MKLQEIKSKAELSKFIESYWYFDGALQPELILLPDGTFNVIVAQHSFSCGVQEFPKGLYLIPITTKPIRLVTKGNLYGIRFKAFSMSNIVGKKAGLIKNINLLETVTAGTLNANAIQGEFSKEIELELRKNALENLAFDLLNHKYELDEQLRLQVNYILERKGDLKISALCEKAGITRQGLHKNFIQSLGIGAKELALTWKLNHFFTLMSDSDSLTGTALDAGFYDQAHCINAFKNTWQLSPGNLQKSNPDLYDFAKESMTKRFNNFYDPEI
jgi:AraC-like DNA-binding protein